jgi:hypothetical protein
MFCYRFGKVPQVIAMEKYLVLLRENKYFERKVGRMWRPCFWKLPLLDEDASSPVGHVWLMERNDWLKRKGT